MLIMREILNPMFGMFKIYPESRILWFHETVSASKFGIFFFLIWLVKSLVNSSRL